MRIFLTSLFGILLVGVGYVASIHQVESEAPPIAQNVLGSESSPETPAESGEQSAVEPVDAPDQPSQKLPLARFKKSIASIEADNPVKVSYVISEASNGDVMAKNKARKFTSASLYKLFLADYVLKLSEDGSLKLSDKVGGSRIDDCLNVMITISDNRCGIILGAQVGWDNLDEYLEANGYNQSFTNNYLPSGAFDGNKQTSAVDVNLWLDRLYNDELLGPISTAFIQDLLLKQEVNNRTPDLPIGTLISHKTGNLEGSIHDAGHISVDGIELNYTILSSGWKDEEKGAASIASALRALINDAKSYQAARN